MSHIFISYSKKNRDYARALADKLLDAGFDVWIDDRIDYGDDWWNVIVKAIRECAAFVVIMTPESDASRWVKREVMLADHLPKPIFPLLRDGDLLSSDNWTMFISTQYADVRDGSFPKDGFYTRLRQVITPKPMRGTEITAPPPTLPEIPNLDLAAAPRSTPAETQRSVGTTPASSAAARPVIKPLSPQKETRKYPRLHQPAWVGKLIPEPFAWCEVPAGKVTLEPTGGDDDYLKASTTFDVPAFQIARYPVTNAQFEVFVTARDGWRDAGWWDYSDAARAWREQNPQSKPARFKDCANCPRETVTWYAAVAFTRWLSAKTGEAITLPTEQQWQRTAQGDDGRAYPWGDAWAAANCNSGESGIGKTTPVTRYPQGASPFGALDMSGNVWEWCVTDYTSGKNEININSEYRVLRGGSWNNLPQSARAAFRNWNFPYFWDFSWGFRVVVGAVPI